MFFFPVSVISPKTTKTAMNKCMKKILLLYILVLLLVFPVVVVAGVCCYLEVRKPYCISTTYNGHPLD